MPKPDLIRKQSYAKTSSRRRGQVCYRGRVGKLYTSIVGLCTGVSTATSQDTQSLYVSTVSLAVNKPPPRDCYHSLQITVSLIEHKVPTNLDHPSTVDSLLSLSLLLAFIIHLRFIICILIGCLQQIFHSLPWQP